MKLKLGPKFERFIREQVKRGDFLTPEEVIREGLRLLQEREQIRQLRLDNVRRELELGQRALDEGRSTAYSDETLPQLLTKIRREGRKRLPASRKRAG